MGLTGKAMRVRIISEPEKAQLEVPVPVAAEEAKEPVKEPVKA